jgi:hypothetical protein
MKGGGDFFLVEPREGITFGEIVRAVAGCKYKKIAYSNFIVLCPKCHKEEHEKIVSQSFTDQNRRHNRFSNTGLGSGWNPE